MQWKNDYAVFIAKACWTLSWTVFLAYQNCSLISVWLQVLSKWELLTSEGDVLLRIWCDCCIYWAHLCQDCHKAQCIYFIVHTQWYIGTQGRYIVPSTQGEVTHMHFFVCSHSRMLSQVDYASEMSKCVSLNTVYLSGTIPLSNKPTLPLPKTPWRCYSQVIS